MAQNFYTDIQLNGLELQGVSLEKLALDPTGIGLYAGRIWYNTVSNKIKRYDGTAIQILADESYVTTSINQLGQIQGGFSAVAGLLPTAANKTQGDLTTIKKGDYWVITAAGTIAGITGLTGVLNVGDLIQFYGSTPATASDWIGIQRNLNDALVGNSKTERQTVNLVANTPLAVNAATITDIMSIQTYDSLGSLIVVQIEKLGGANQRTLTSKKSLTGVVVELIGAL